MKSIEAHWENKAIGRKGDFIGLACKSGQMMRYDWKEVRILASVEEEPLSEISIFLAKVS